MEKWQRSLYQPNLPLGADGTKVTASKAHITLSKEAAKEGMVLLKNNESLLPFQAGTKLALFGKGSFDYVKGGGGSGDVTVAYTTNLYEGFKKLPEKVEVYEALSDYYRKEVEKQYEAGAEPGMTVEPAFPEETAKKARAYTDTAVICISRFSGEGWDRKSSYDKEMDESVQTDPLLEKAERIFPDGDFYLTKEESAMVEQVQQLFPKVAVVMNVGGMVDTDWFAENEKIQAVLMAWQGGMEGGSAAAELLCGVGSPSGKLSDTFAKKLEDYPSSETFHESVKYVDYKEDIYVGYRYFETIPGADKAVNYPFGYGLSSTTFERALVSAEEKQGVIRVRVNVTNTGKYPGKEVMQLYAQAPQGVLGKAKRVLAAFEKTRLLAQGETQLLTLEAPVAQLASYDDLGKIQKSAYVLEKGKYQFYLGTSVRETEQVFCFTMPEDTVTEQLTAKLVPTSLAERMLSDGSFEKLPQSEPNDPDYSAIKRVPREESDGFSPAVRALPGHQIWSQPYKKDAHIFMEVAEGKITLDGIDIRDIKQHDLREKLGYVPQKGVLFSGNIASNIMFGNQDGTEEEMKEAAEIAQATEFIETKPEGYESPIAQGGSNVSGGQKQRLSIARAIAKHPQVFIFDDSFSALDYKTDVTLRHALAEKTRESTVLIVAQRISTILHAEQILVLDDGKIVGKGTHAELLKNCEVYREIAESQLSRAELESAVQTDGKEEKIHG